MMKRPRSNSVSSTASEDAFEPLLRAEPKRLKTDASLSRERPRPPAHKPGPLEGMPAEVRTQIIRDLIDPHDLLNSVEAVEWLRRTGPILNRDVEMLMREPDEKKSSAAPAPADRAPQDFQRSNPVLTTAGKLLVYNKRRFALLPIKNSATTREELTLQDNVSKCDLLSVAGKDEKSDLTRDVLGSRDTPLKYDALDSLALNVAYLEPHDRAALVGSVCARHKEFIEDEVPAGLGSTVKALIERAEHLSPMEQGQVADAALKTADPATKTQYLEAFAGKIDVIVMPDTQKRIVDAIVADETEGKGYRLGVLAEGLGRRSASELAGTAFDSAREKIADAILELDQYDAGRLWAMSKLAEKLDSVAPRTLSDIKSAAANALVRRVVEVFDEDSALWYTEPSTSRVEMAHHLSTHKHLLTEDEADNVSAFIRGTLALAGNHRAKAQLLPHMESRERGQFVEKYLPDHADPIVEDENLQEAVRQVVEGMTFRVEHLNEGEKQTYAYYLNYVLSADNPENALNYTISNNLRHFPPKDANHIARMAISRWEDFDLESVAGIFNHIARQAAHLDTSTVVGVVRKIGEITAKLLPEAESEENATLRSLAVFAAQSVANKSLEILAKGTTGLDAHLEAQRQHIQRGYDDRSKNRER